MGNRKKTRVCRFCGKEFETEDGASKFCSPLCLQMGNLIGTKGGAAARHHHPKANGEEHHHEKAEKHEAVYARVDEQFALPPRERWRSLTWTELTEEEKEYASRRAKREMYAERRMDKDMDGEENKVSERYRGYGGEVMGDSDDGTV